jgi:hypothetical protein
VRDYLYGWSSQLAMTENMRNVLTGAGQPGTLESTVTQLFLLATMHQRISRTYYTQRLFSQVSG